MGEDNTGKLDLGIFIASIVPDGPADKDGRIKPGTERPTMGTGNIHTGSQLNIQHRQNWAACDDL